MTTSTSVHSNAFNFMSFLQNGVDPRTGQYTVNITLPDVKSNGLRGPAVPLNLSYNPLNTQDNGYGLGWDLQLSEYDPGRQILALSTGETFKVTDTSGTRWVMEEQKIDSFHFYQDDVNHYRVMHKSGLVEILEVRGNDERSVALPIRIFEPSGHAITLDYVPFSTTHQRLSWIKDDLDNTLLEIRRDLASDTSIEYLLHPDESPGGGPLARFVMNLLGADKRVSAIILPTENQASWRFEYGSRNGQVYIEEVHTPTGGREEIYYLDDGHGFPGSAGRLPLPRVTRHIVFPGADQPQVDVRYTYEHDEDGRPVQHNFLGFGLPISWNSDGSDNLYLNPNEYDYTCTESLFIDDALARSIERKFNRFHLLTREVTTQGLNIQTVETTYNLTPGALFKDQPKTCQLPIEVKTSWRIEGQPTRSRSESVTSTYDVSGNLLDQKQANGVTEASTWYHGGDGIPLEPEGFVRFIKDKTITPATPGYGAAPTLVTRYSYKALDAVEGSDLDNWLVPESETLVQTAPGAEQVLQQTVFEYFDDPGDPFQHGRVARQIVTMGGSDTTTSYVYSRHESPEFGESVQRTLQTLTGFDGQQKIITLEHSMLTGEPLLNRDDNDVEIRYLYDNLRRVLRETVAPDDDVYRAYRRYEYYLCANDGEQAEQWMFDVKGVKTCTRLDGLNRAVYEERDDADNPAHPETPLQTYSAVYDQRGNLVTETEYDWMYKPLDGGELQVQLLALTSTFEYDDWGTQRCIIGPDGVKTFEETDPIGTQDSQGPIQRSWTESSDAQPDVSAVTETWLNLFEKPTRIQRLIPDPESAEPEYIAISLSQNHYDGLGRTVETIVGFPSLKRERKTLNTYDAFDRITATTLPDTAIVYRSYAAHSSEDLPIAISVEADGKTLVLGEQAFDGLDRMTKTITGGRERVLSYDPGQLQPKAIRTASQQDIGYQYLPLLSEEPLRRQLPGVTANYEYDPQNAKLLSCEEQGEQLAREYYSTGQLKSEQRVSASNQYNMYYRYSRLGRLQSYTDVLGQEQRFEYDEAGRLEKTVLGDTLTSDFTYDPLGRTASITTTDSGSGKTVGISLAYDESGRETLRTFDLDGVKQELAQVYDDIDDMTQRTLTENDGAVLIRQEDYRYDLRGRLTQYDCQGTQPPVDPYGKTIKQQIFTFDGLDNLTLVMTTFDGGMNRARYIYEGDDPVQLSKVTNTPLPADPAFPAEITLEYDLDGNLTCDEVGRSLSYDALGRLIQVGTEPAGSQYHYDPLDKLTGETRNAEQDQRFYRDGELANQLKGSQSSTFIRGDERLLAELQGNTSVLLAVSDNNSVFNEVTASVANASTYTAYGHRSGESAPIARLGFNGELVEADTGWQLLGSGYRAYNPLLMRFHSPDTLSPFGEGGVNAYAYCEGDPVNFIDPTGHSLVTPFKMLGRLFRPVSTTKSKGFKKAPEYLKQKPDRISKTRAYPLEEQDVKNLERVTLYRKTKADRYVGEVSEDFIRGRRLNNPTAAEQTLDARYFEVKEAFEFAKGNLNQLGITKYARKALRNELKTIEKEATQAKLSRQAQYRHAQTNPRAAPVSNRKGWVNFMSLGVRSD